MPPSCFSCLYDAALLPIERLGLSRLRREVVAGAGGIVVEAGAGTGLNLPHYRCARCVVATDPDDSMLLRARKRIARAPVPSALVLADAQQLPFRDCVFDTAVATFTFCTVPDPEAGLRELFRVLKPGGELLLLEHVRASSRLAAGLQDAATPLWRRIAGGCRLNRPTLETAVRSGFEPVQCRSLFRDIVVHARLIRPPRL